MLARIVGASCVLGQGDRLREPRGPAWPNFQLLEHEDFRARPSVRLNEMHAKIEHWKEELLATETMKRFSSSLWTDW